CCLVVLSLRPISTLFPYTTLFRSKLAQTFRRVVDAFQPADNNILNPVMPDHVHRFVDAGGRIKTVDIGPALIDQQAHILEGALRSEEHTSELQSRENLVCRLLLEK